MHNAPLVVTTAECFVHQRFVFKKEQVAKSTTCQKLHVLEWLLESGSKKSIPIDTYVKM